MYYHWSSLISDEHSIRIVPELEWDGTRHIHDDDDGGDDDDEDDDDDDDDNGHFFWFICSCNDMILSFNVLMVFDIHTTRLV